MSDDSVATMEGAAEETIRPPRRRRWRWWIIGGAGAAGALLVAALFLIQLPYFVIQPGSVKAAERQIQISGAPSYDNDGRVMFVTVFVNRATPALVIRSWLDESVKLKTPEEMFPNSSEAESRRENVILMDDSKLIATKVALDYLGIPVEFTAQGALVAGLADASPSENILEPGNIIVEVDGDPVAMPADIGVALEDNEPGEMVGLVIESSETGTDTGESAGRTKRSKRRRVEVALGADPKDPTRPVLGIYVEPYQMSVESPVDVEIDSGDVGGPSAGLAWTLGVIDRLSSVSLTSGRKVAVTGEIRSDGTILPVGGTPQKVAAVKRAGVEVFLYPATTPDAEKAEIKRLAGRDLEIHEVADVEEAVKVLVPAGIHRD